MSFDTYESSVDSARPVEVYDIVAGTQSFFYTSAQDDQLIGAQTYTAVDGLQRGPVADGPNKREADFQLELPTTDPLSQIFTGQQPGIRISLKVKKFHRLDLPTPEVIQIFDGFIQSASFKLQAKKTILTARPTITAVGRQVPRRVYSAACNHVLYDTVTCKVDDTDPLFRASALTVSSVVGNIMTLTVGLSGVYADGFMNAGFVEFIGQSDFRLILDHTGNVLELQQPFSTNPTSVNVFAGCGHSVSVCSSKFNNVDRYGGFPFVPTKNPYSTGII